VKKLDRRDFLKYSSYGLATLVVSSGIAGCSGDSDTINDDSNIIDMSFTHGVASGDPLSDRVIIWTRAVPTDTQTHDTLDVSFEIATDESFTSITNNGSAQVTATGDYILKVDVTNLDPAITYYYRFISHGQTSITGKTKTLPSDTAEIDKVKLAIVSCSNYTNGYFNVYTEAAKIADLDAVVHLGDYIYEYKMGEYATENAIAIGRELPEDNDVELIELEDYRKRYALYRTDSGSLTLHQNVPFIVVPDDHEVANDTYIDGAENHDPDTEGDFFVRKANALQAYFEWMPIRPFTEDDEETLYRSFAWGDLVNLIMLDTRLIGRSKQLTLSDPSFFNSDGTFNSDAFIAAVSDSERTMLGIDQFDWLMSNLAASSATWQVLGQQTLMGRMNLPIEILLGLGAATDISVALTELSTIKARMLAGDTSVTGEERARLLAAAPYNLDAWDGYQYERDVILNSTLAQAKNLVVLAGDTHNAWANNLTTLDGTAAGVEFATSSVSSPGLEYYLGLDEESIVGLEQGLSLLIDDLQTANLYHRGFMTVTFTPQQAEAQWVFIDNIDDTEYGTIEGKSFSFTSLANTNTLV